MLAAGLRRAGRTHRLDVLLALRGVLAAVAVVALVLSVVPVTDGGPASSIVAFAPRIEVNANGTVPSSATTCSPARPRTDAAPAPRTALCG